MNIIGLSAFYHNSACCLLKDGKLVAAAEEERFTRLKGDASLPVHAMKYCLQHGGISLQEVDLIAYYENPQLKFSRQLWSGILGDIREAISSLNPKLVEEKIRDTFGYTGSIFFSDHHMSHAASAFYFSGFNQSTILTVDGVGEWASTTYCQGDGNEIKRLKQIDYPNSIGLLYSTLTNYLGFEVNDGEYKVMGLAPYGEPKYIDRLRELISFGNDGEFILNMKYFDFSNSCWMFTQDFEDLFRSKPRKEEDKIEKVHIDIARSLQFVLEEILISMANYLFNITNSTNLCMAGGVALNCVANARLLKSTPFKQLFVQPASNDAGCALGAAKLAYKSLSEKNDVHEEMTHVFYGPGYVSNDIYRFLSGTSVNFHDLRDKYTTLIKQTASKISEGKVVAWFQGRMEFGPRALGNRSILADPRNGQMRDKINNMVKKREDFRPFAPVVLEDEMFRHFDIDHVSPFMLETCKVISPINLPATTHIDGSARLQTVNKSTNSRFFDLIEEFYSLTNCPVLLNTSFNVKGEPIVCNYEDALRCFVTSEIDCLVLEDFLIDRSENDFSLLNILLLNDNVKPVRSKSNVYSFI